MESKVQIIKVSYTGRAPFWSAFVKQVLELNPEYELVEVYTKQDDLTEVLGRGLIYHNPYGPAILQPNHPDPSERMEFWINDYQYEFDEYLEELEYQNLCTPKEIALIKMKYSK